MKKACKICLYPYISGTDVCDKCSTKFVHENTIRCPHCGNESLLTMEDQIVYAEKEGIYSTVCGHQGCIKPFLIEVKITKQFISPPRHKFPTQKEKDIGLTLLNACRILQAKGDIETAKKLYDMAVEFDSNNLACDKPSEHDFIEMRDIIFSEEV